MQELATLSLNYQEVQEGIGYIWTPAALTKIQGLATEDIEGRSHQVWLAATTINLTSEPIQVDVYTVNALAVVGA